MSKSGHLFPATSARMSRALRAALFALAAAAPAARPQDRADSLAAPRVRIINPDHDAVVTGRNVAVVLEAHGVLIAPALEHRPGTAHVDLFLDRDLTPADSAVPFWTPGIVHLSRGQSWRTLENVSPGAHRLIAVLVDANHLPLTPLVADTVRFTLTRRR